MMAALERDGTTGLRPYFEDPECSSLLAKAVQIMQELGVPLHAMKTE